MNNDLNIIGFIMKEAQMLEEVRHEIRSAIKDIDPVVMDGRRYSSDSGSFDLVVLCDDKNHIKPVSRRIKSIKGLTITKLADNVLGVNHD